ncbi:MAG TPA: metal ABC transporter ATP-binding protein [Dehalococcoidia bacterium]|nr:metal ABC transporter ATP-binding protein [Dehalococcoidia bacterium]
MALAKPLPQAVTPGQSRALPVEAAARPLVELCGVSIGYQGTPVLSDVNLAIAPGQFAGIVGPSGSGKTSLLRAMLGAVEVYRGEVLVDGKRVSGRRRAHVGYVPQLETVDWNFPVTVAEVVLMGRTMESGPWPWARRRDRERMFGILERLGLADLHNRHIRNLSGGQQQRVFLARALIRSPKLLLLDEPTSGVDIRTRDDILHILADLNAEGVTVIMATHEINAVAAHLPFVVCVNGAIVAQGHPDDVFTPEVLSRTYKAPIFVLKQDGLTLVSDMPHFLKEALARGQGHVHEHEHSHSHEHVHAGAAGHVDGHSHDG